MAVPLKKRADGIITGADWDHLATDFLGEGRDRYTASYVVYTDGTDVYAFNGTTGIIDYGGPNDNGGVDGADPTAVLQAVINVSTAGERIYVENGEYAINVRGGLLFSGIEDLVFRGSSNTVFKYTYAATALNPVIQMFSIEGTCKNIVISNIKFDMDESSYSDAQRPVGAGLAWIGRVTGSSENILITNCHFLNSPVVGLVGGTVDGYTIQNCYFDNIGEHCFYFNGSTNVWVDNCKMLNWAKWIRGWGFKVAGASKHVYIKNIYGEPNEDGLGYLDSLGTGSEPMLLSVDGACRDINFKNIVGIGDVAITARPAFQVDNSYFVTIENLDVADWNHLIFKNTDAERYTSLLNSYIENMAIWGFPMMTNNCVLFDSPKYSTTEGQDDLTIKQTTWVRDDVTHDFHLLYLGRGGSTSSNIVLEDCKFFNWVYRIVDAVASIDSVIRDCYFSGGTTGWCIDGAGTRVAIESNFFDTDVTHGTATIDIQGGSVDILETNRISGVLATNINSTLVNRCRDNIGYVTENSGTATIIAANTAIAVAHGCDYTPSAADIDVSLTNQPTNDIGDVWVNTIGAVNFTINCRNVPGVATAIFAWGISRI